MKRSGHILFSVFFAVLTALVLGLIVTTAFPVDSQNYDRARYEQTSLWRMMLSLALSTVAMVAGLATPIRLEVFRIGLLLGALISLVVANVWAWGYENDWIRLAAAVVSLILAGIAGWWQFNPRRQSAPPSGSTQDVTASRTDGDHGELPDADASALAARVDALERRLDRTGAALREDPPRP